METINLLVFKLVIKRGYTISKTETKSETSVNFGF